MSAYEMMLSESQERMLMVLDPAREEEAAAIFQRWGLDFATIGRTTDTLRFVVKHGGAVVADLPIKELGDQAPLYDRPYTLPAPLPTIAPEEVEPPVTSREALLYLLRTPDLCSRRWVWEQYDHIIGGNTVTGPGGDAALIRVEDGPKGLALTADCTPRYCEADPVEGGRQAVAEAWRNLTATGALPLALTDNLNFGNPERPEAMGQLVGCIRGIGEAARALDFPVVSGNVSLSNETSGRGIWPTPTIGGVGLVDDVAVRATIGFKREGEAVVVVGATAGALGQSLYLREICNREEGAPPPVDLEAERRNGDFVRGLIRSGRVDTAHDCSDGGLAAALAEMAMAGGIGATLLPRDMPSTVPAHGFLFGEDGARYVVTCPADALYELRREASEAGVPTWFLGLTGGDALTLAEEEPISISLMQAFHEGWLPAFMAGDGAGSPEPSSPADDGEPQGA
jgi:phosphoribosylformylglycinamidine synthase